jgi:P27 family predicted phage terminase small subunit
MRGRRPIPTALKLVSGNPGRRPLPKDEPQPEGNLHEPPEAMSDEQKAEWRYAIENAPLGLLRWLDRNLFAQWCIASVDLTEAELILRTEGKVVNRGGDQRITINPDGTQVKTVRSASRVINPWVRARYDAFVRMMKTEAELGFSPTSRSRITLAGGGQKTKNRFSNNAANKRA